MSHITMNKYIDEHHVTMYAHMPIHGMAVLTLPTPHPNEN